jgi:hypothetical protein|tara:strand:+ start:1067 stop:1288 length:222 start_codon:yes stop_codon:yes gene_type:complete
MITKFKAADIYSLESLLQVFIQRYNASANKKSLETICVGINAIIEHEDFDLLADCHCRYHKMQMYWQWRYHAV